MKKTLLFYILTMITLSVSAQQISVSEALAKAAALRDTQNGMAKGATSKSLTDGDVSGTVAGTLTALPTLCYTRQDNGNTIYYVFNYPDGGFAIIGGDRTARTVLGYSESGTFSQDDMPNALKDMLDIYAKQISLAIDIARNSSVQSSADTPSVQNSADNGQAKSSMLTDVTAASKSDVHIDFKTKWNQSYPYNILLKSTRGSNTYFLTGCVATAGAQLMKYYNYPAKRTGSMAYKVKVAMPDPSDDFDTTFVAGVDNNGYKWTLMKDTYGEKEVLTSTQLAAIGGLLRDVGVSVQMNYGTQERGGSSSDLRDLGIAMQTYFGYDKSITFNAHDYYDDSTWADMLYTELQAGRPVIYRGASNKDGGHAFVIYGYRASDDTYEVNWGWGGKYDGYYPITGVDPLNYHEIAGSGFTSYQAMLRSIKPEAGGKAQTNIVLYSPITFENSTQQMTISDRSNGATIRFGQFFILNQGYKDVNIYYGIECTNKETGRKYTMTDPNALSVPANKYSYVMNDFSISKTSSIMKENGIYEIRPIFHLSGETTWSYMPMPQDYELSTIIVNGGTDNPTKDIAFTIDNTSVQEGDKLQINHSEGYAGQISYSSANENIAKVNSQGLITAITPGKTTITVTGLAHGAYRETTKTLAITVTKHSVSAVPMSIDSHKTIVDKYCTISVNASNYTGEVAYSSSNDSIAIVSPDGKVYGIRPGTAYITARASSTSLYHTTTYFFDVTVEDSTAESAIDEAEVKLVDGLCFYDHITKSNNGYILDNASSSATLRLINNSSIRQSCYLYYMIYVNGISYFSGPGAFGATFPANYKLNIDFSFDNYITALRNSNLLHYGDTVRFDLFRNSALTDRMNIPSFSMIYTKEKTTQYVQDSNRYGTLMLPYDADVPSGLTAYECNGYANKDAILTQRTTMVANTPYIIKGTAGTYSFTGPDIKSPAALCGNGLLFGTTEGGVSLTASDYTLSRTHGISSFACYTADGVTLDSNRAIIRTDSTYLHPYIVLPQLSGETQVSTLSGDADADGTVTLHDAQIATAYYLGKYVKIDTDAADTNNDGNITITDANTMINSALKPKE